MTRTGSWFLAFALLTWTLCFLVLRHLVTWVPFAFVGLALAIVAVSQRVVPRWLLRPSIGSVTLGLASGALMVVATPLAYRGVVAFAPPVAGATRQLLALLNVVGFSPLVRALLSFEREGFAAFEAAYAQRDLLRGGQVVTTDSACPRGEAIGVDADGALQVRDEGGQVHRIVSGEVSVRPAPAAEPRG